MIRRRRLEPCDGAAGDRTLGPLAGGNVSPQASPGGPNGFSRRARYILTRRPTYRCEREFADTNVTQRDN